MKCRIWANAIGAAVSALMWAQCPAIAADHRDAPTIDDYSAIDINDFYMFRDPNKFGYLVVALTTQAVADPKFGSSYHFQPNAVYRFNFSIQGATPTASIDFVFSPFGNSVACPAPQPACQTYVATFNLTQPNIPPTPPPPMFKDDILQALPPPPVAPIVVSGVVTQGTSSNTHLPPQNLDFANGAITIFAGPREDPFFFDLVGFNLSIASGSNRFTGDDAFKGKNVNAIVVEFPVGLMFPIGCVGSITSAVFSTPCSAWTATYLGDFDPNAETPFNLRQVDRMANPAVNTALIPAALKDAFNFGQPSDDAATFGGTILGQILALDKAFGTCPQSATAAGACNPFTSFLTSVAVPDTLKFAVNLPDGFPNGRPLSDRVTDTLISLILQLPNFTDGTKAKTYCPSFPFLGPPLQPTNVINGGTQACP
jgi:hypothetical protein